MLYGLRILSLSQSLVVKQSQISAGEVQRELEPLPGLLTTPAISLAPMSQGSAASRSFLGITGCSSKGKLWDRMEIAVRNEVAEARNKVEKPYRFPESRLALRYVNAS